MRNRVNGAMRAAALPLIGCMLVACNGTEGSQGGANSMMETAPVTRGDLTVTAEAAGQIEPIRLVEVKSKASGEITEIHIETGDVVTTGQLLVRIDPRDVRNAFDQADADLEVARARLATAEAQRKRSEELRAANVVTDQEFESALLEEANARAQFIKAQTNLQLARERLNDVTIRAPINGTVIAETIEIGQIIASASQNISGGTTLLTMADLAEMQVRALVDETDLGRIDAGLNVRVRVEAYPDRIFEGEVLKIEPQAVVEQNVTMFPVLVRLDNREGLLKPGMNADVEVRIADRSGILLVPNSAVVGARDLATAAEVLGLDVEAVREQMRGGMAANGSTGNGARAETAQRATPAGSPGSQVAQERERGAQPASPEGPGAAPVAAGSVDDDECAALMEKMRRGGGPQALTEAERTRLRSCRAQTGGAMAQTGRGSAGDIRPGFVFVINNGTIEARRVMLGVNDWDNTEVVSGLEEGDSVILMSVARLQAQQAEFENRLRERTSGPFPGGTTGGRR